MRDSRAQWNVSSSTTTTPEEITFQNWLAKGIQLCAMKKQNDLGLELWKKYSEQLTCTPELNLAMSVAYCIGGSSSAENEVFHEVFNCACARSNNNTENNSTCWNDATNAFPVNL